jgi:hypothetical protein
MTNLKARPTLGATAVAALVVAQTEISQYRGGGESNRDAISIEVFDESGLDHRGERRSNPCHSL